MGVRKARGVVHATGSAAECRVESAQSGQLQQQQEKAANSAAAAAPGVLAVKQQQLLLASWVL
jgi:hypothetical protein